MINLKKQIRHQQIVEENNAVQKKFQQLLMHSFDGFYELFVESTDKAASAEAKQAEVSVPIPS